MPLPRKRQDEFKLVIHGWNSCGFSRLAIEIRLADGETIASNSRSVDRRFLSIHGTQGIV
jgi:hypothetical protein